MTAVRDVDVLVVGAGPAGLAAAARLAAAGAGRIEVLERERRAGGVPRHCAHGGFGTLARPLTGPTPARPLTGPALARLLTDAAVRAGAAVRTGVTALDWAGPLALATVGPHGHETLRARAVVLATGARERPRAARLVPGTRPAGVYTTGELQQAVHLYRQPVGARAVVVGAEDVAHAAVETLRAAGTDVVALVTDRPRAPMAPLRAADARLRRGIPLLTRTTVTELLGHGRPTGVRVRRDDGRTAVLPCDTVVFTGDFVPEPELARRGGIALDAATRGPAVDGRLRTSRPGVFAVGSVLHAVESAATAVREGAHAAAAVRDLLAGAAGWPDGVPVTVEPPLRRITPNRVAPGDTLPHLLRTASPVTGRAALHIAQDGRLLHRRRLRPGTAVPHRTLRLPADWTARVDPRGGPVRVWLA
ncbi:NAD(P)/FAD-dependent oxidoreductase [Streptomyces echinoruber]|uniref:Oxidoreductase n=1 Tax=Streptomyces echinoruber TaxID=68898 RepID=A0A918RSA6_9ACTN|nr:FAD-dependent oxidoreductase [Streptomyces echinoruber]GHA07334.1 oxidoreductase [Streptomyces echinoruber]